MQILDGKKTANLQYQKLADQLEQDSSRPSCPCLVVILVGDDPASAVYVRNKEAACQKVGVESRVIRLESDVSESALLAQIDALNRDDTVTGMIVQVPLPDHISEDIVLRSIDPKKDMDGFHPANLGEVYLSTKGEMLPPATPAGIIALLDEYEIDVSGKNAVVLGRSNHVGKACAVMLLNRNATVTVCHSKTPDIRMHTKNADIIIVAVGIPHFLTADMVKEGVVIVDVGIHRTDGGLVGDVDFEAVAPKASYISPVPGGVGPMTVASLVANTVRSFQAKG